MIAVNEVCKRFSDRVVLDDISFELKAGEIVGLVGPSGGGKSVLLKILGGIILPDDGAVSLPHRAGRLDVGFLFQEGALFDSLTVLENVAFPLQVAKDRSFFGGRRERRDGGTAPRGEALERAYEILEEVGLSGAWRKLPGELSGGMRRRVGLARSLVSRPELVLLDDPTGGLDPVAASVIMNLIAELHRHYAPIVVMASHDLRRLIPSVQRVLGLFDGRIVFDVPPQELRAAASPPVLNFLATRFDFSSLEQPA